MIYINLDKAPATLKEIRKRMGMTQAQFAEALGLHSPATISHYERGHRDMPLSVLSQAVELAGWRMRIVFDKKDTE